MQQNKSTRTGSNLERPQPRPWVVNGAGLRSNSSRFGKWRSMAFIWLPLLALASAKQKQTRQDQGGQLTHYDIQPGNAAACFNHAAICFSSKPSPS